MTPENVKRNITSIVSDINVELADLEKKYFSGAQEKCLPMKTLGYCLNKREFRDAITLRYGWSICGMPIHCVYGKKNSIEHCLICTKGGFVTMRHNAVRNTEAALMKDVTTDVQIEPDLLPVGNVQLANGTNLKTKARLDIAARGIWSSCERTMFDVRITHPCAPSNMNKSIEDLLEANEIQKMKCYNDRVIQVEKSTFVPLVYSTNGDMGKQCQKLHQQLASLISAKTGDMYSKVMATLRTRIRFALLNSTLVAIRGYRGKPRKDETIPLAEVDFGLVSDETVS